MLCKVPDTLDEVTVLCCYLNTFFGDKLNMLKLAGVIALASSVITTLGLPAIVMSTALEMLGVGGKNAYIAAYAYVAAVYIAVIVSREVRRVIAKTIVRMHWAFMRLPAYFSGTFRHMLNLSRRILSYYPSGTDVLLVFSICENVLRRNPHLNCSIPGVTSIQQPGER